MNSTQYSDNLCQAIEIIANKVVQGLNYDKTILCTITNNKNASKGEYTVSDGISSYSVYSSNQTYKVNTQVYVLIPNGDYEAQKLIISEYSSADDVEKGYSLPSDTIIPVETIYSYTKSEEETGLGLKANINGEGNKGSGIKLSRETDKENSNEYVLNDKLSPNYTRLLLDCEFQTDFGNKEIQSGNYSIVITINGLDKDGSEIKDKEYIFDCSNFFGNPYNFEGSVQQSTVFDISAFSKINTINAQFQESGNFYDINGDYLFSEKENIFLNKISIIIGFDISEYKNNDLLITTADELNYDNQEEKSLRLNWIRNRNNNTLFSINKTQDINLSNYNYLEHLWRTSGDTSYAGKNSNYLSFYWYRYTLNDNLPTDILLQENYWKVEKYYNDKFYSSLPSEEQKNFEFSSPSDEQKIFEFLLTPEVIGVSREKIKVAIVISGCLRKKVLKTQNIKIDDKTIEAAIVSKVNEYEGKVQYLKPEYDYTYYSPLDEIKVEEIFEEEKSGLDENDEAIVENIKAYSIDEDGKYVDEGKSYQRVKIEWVQYYSMKELLTETTDGDTTPIYGKQNFIYLTDAEYNELLSKKYNNNQIYNLTLKPMMILKSSEIIFENKDKGIYKKLNLIRDIKLEATDELQGNYLIYDFANTIPETMANSPNRNIKATISNINSKDVITDNVVFQWKFPKFNTMLNEPESFILDNEKYNIINKKGNNENKLYWTDNEDGFYISSLVEIKNTSSGEKDETQELSIEIPYTIKKYYSTQQNNNKIILSVYKRVEGALDEDLKINTREIDLSFGSSGTNGTNYTFVLNLGCQYTKNENNYIKISEINQSFLKASDETNWIKVEPHLYEGNKELEIDNNYSIDWSWYIEPHFKEKRNCSISETETEEKDLNYKTVDLENPSNNILYIRTCRNNNFCDENIDISKYTNQSELKTSESFIGRYHCAILKATINYNSKLLEAYLPIPMSFKSEVYSYSGVEKIVYNANGTNPQYYQNSHKIFKINKETNELKEIPVDYVMCVNHEKILNDYSYPYFDTNKKITYKEKSFLLYDILHENSFNYYCGYNEEEFTIQPDGSRNGTLYKFRKSNLSYMGTLENVVINKNDVKASRIKFMSEKNIFSATSNCERILKAQPIYYSSNSIPKISIIARDLDETTYYVQPVLIIQNRFGNSMLNEWDGKLIVDDKNNYILSAQVGAGIKNDNNSFTGVLMGDVTRSDLGSGVNKIGLYGYSKGALTFGFDIDGKAFLGASGKGRINFDGNNATIQSGNYKKNESGTLIDLDDGKIEGYNLKLSSIGDSGAFLLQSSNSPLFQIKGHYPPIYNFSFRYNNTDYKLDLYAQYAGNTMVGVSYDNNLKIQLYKITFNGDADSLSLIKKTGEEYTLTLTDKGKNENATASTGYIYKLSADRDTFVSKISKIEALTLGNWEYHNTYIRWADAASKQYIEFRPLREDKYKDLLIISDEDYYLRSLDYNYIKAGHPQNRGILFDLKNNHLRAHKFNIQTTKGDGGYIKIDSTASNYPIIVQGSEVEEYCKIGWDGILHAKGASIAGRITAEEGKIGKWDLVNEYLSYNAGIKDEKGVFTNGKAFIAPGGVLASNAAEDKPFAGNTESTKFVLGIGSKFGVTTDGTLYATNVNISGTITATSGSFTDCTIKNSCTIEKGLNIGLWKVGEESLYYQSATFTNGHAFLFPGGKQLTQFNKSANWVLGIGSRFGVTDYGSVFCSNINITGGEMNIENGTFKVTPEGKLTATSATIIGTISSSTITGSTITGGTIQTANSKTNSSRVVIDSNGTISCYYYNTLYGKITTTNTSTDKYWTLLGHLDSNWSSVAYRGITLGFDLGSWGEEKTARYTLQATQHDFMGPVFIEEMWLDYGTSNARILYYDKGTVKFSGGSNPLELYVSAGGFQLATASHSNLMTINREFNDGQIHFQQPTHFGSTVYNNAGGIVFTSDRNTKNSILPLAESHEIFFKNLKPVIFKYNNGTSDRFHTGFIAQDVLAAIENCGLTTQDIGAYIKHEVILENESYIEQALRYDEFIALNTHMIQKCLKRIEVLETELNTLKAQL